MGVQAQGNISTVPFVQHGMPAVSRTNQTILTDGSRATPLAPFTLMAKVAASQKWVPWTDVDAIDGSAIPQGIYIGPSIAAATLVAGDVENVEILTGNAIYDLNQLVIENSLTLASVIAGSSLAFDAGTGDATATLTNSISLVARDALAFRNLYDNDSIDITAYEA